MTDRLQPTAGAIRVGDFVVDPRSGELRGESGRQVLSAQPLHVLLALLERPGDLVTRDELRARLWPSDTFVDFEHGLNAVVKRLREALGDSADTPRYIETVPRRGYRLIADVRTVGGPVRAEAEPVQAAPAHATTVPPPAAPRRRNALVAFAALALLAVGAAAYLLGSWRAAAAVRPAPVLAAVQNRLTFGAGIQTDASWSPDGSRIAFAADRDGNFDLFIVSSGGGEPVRLTSSPANETQPAWSPDGSRLVFRSDDDGGGLFTIGIDGSSARRIAGPGDRPVWMPDGRTVAFAGPGLQAIYLVGTHGGDSPREILAGPLAQGAWFSFNVHPDGRIGVLGIHHEQRVGFYMSDRAYTTLRPLTGSPMKLPAQVGRALWSARGDALFLEGQDSNGWSLWRVPIDRGTPAWEAAVRLATSLVAMERAAVSNDGTMIAFTSLQSSTRAWVFPFDPDRGTPPGDGHPVTDEDASVLNLSLSADGKAIYYQESRPGQKLGPQEAKLPLLRTSLDTRETRVIVDGGAGNPVPSADGGATAYLLYRVPAASDFEYALAWRDKAHREQLISSWGPNLAIPTAMRRDQQAVLASLMPRALTGSAALVEWPLGSGRVAEPSRVLLASSTRQFWQGRYSPDGRWVSFVVGDVADQGRLELGIVPASATRASSWTRVAADHVWPDKPRWSPDGRTLYFLSKGAGGLFNLWAARIDPERGVPAGAPFQLTHFDSTRWHIDSRDAVCEMGIAEGRLVLPMASVRGSIWLLSTAGS